MEAAASHERRLVGEGVVDQKLQDPVVAVGVARIQRHRHTQTPVRHSLAAHVDDGGVQDREQERPQFGDFVVAPVLGAANQAADDLGGAALTRFVLVGDELLDMRNERVEEFVFEDFEKVLKLFNHNFYLTS